jgi:type VI secretion system secreted protein Hcp
VAQDGDAEDSMSSGTIFIEIDGVKGESTAEQGKDKIEILSWNHGVAMPLTSGASNTARAHGRTVHQDFSFTKYVDITTPTLALKCSGGDDIKKIELTIFQADKNDGPMVQYYTITLEDCILTNVSISGGPGDRPVETVSVNYRKIKWSYKKQGAPSPGGDKGKAEAGWDLEKNKKQ